MSSTSPTVEIHHSSPVPLHEQVAAARRYGYRPEELTAIIEQVSVEPS